MTPPRNTITIPLIKRHVAAVYHLAPADITSRRRGKGCSEPRQIAMYLAATLSANSLPEIGTAFVRDHTTVMHARKVVEMRMEADPEYEAIVRSIRIAVLSDANPPTGMEELATRLVLDATAMFRQAGLQMAAKDPERAIRLLAPLAAAVGAPLPNEVTPCGS